MLTFHVLYKVLLESVNTPEYFPEEKYPHLSPPLVRNNERLLKSFEILSHHIDNDTPMAIVTDVYSQTSHYSNPDNLLGSDFKSEEVIVTKFGDFLKYKDKYRFFTTVIIGEEITQKSNNYIYTPQWSYNWEYKREYIEKIKNIDVLVSV